MKKMTYVLLVVVSILLANSVYAEEENKAKDLALFLGKWKGERENNMGWEMTTERYRLIGYRSVTMKVFVKEDRLYVKYSLGTFESHPAHTRKIEAEIRYLNGEPRLCFEYSNQGVQFRLDKGILKGKSTYASKTSTCSLARDY
jgi:hypothetical protein